MKKQNTLYLQYNGISNAFSYNQPRKWQTIRVTFVIGGDCDCGQWKCVWKRVHSAPGGRGCILGRATILRNATMEQQLGKRFEFRANQRRFFRMLGIRVILLGAGRPSSEHSFRNYSHEWGNVTMGGSQGVRLVF